MGLPTYHAVGEDNSDLCDSSGELVLSDAAFILNVEEFESLGEVGGIFLRGWALLLKFGLQVLFKAVHTIG